jgi:hypothetical protein
MDRVAGLFLKAPCIRAYLHVFDASVVELSDLQSAL